MSYRPLLRGLWVVPFVAAGLLSAKDAPVQVHRAAAVDPDRTLAGSGRPVVSSRLRTAPTSMSHEATATEPASGTMDINGNLRVEFDAPNRAGAATGPGDCLGPNCSKYLVTIGDPGSKHVRVRLDWQFVSNDYDVYIFREPDGQQVESSGNGTTTYEETRFVPEPNTIYEVVIVHFATAVGDNVHGILEFVNPPAVREPLRIGPDDTGIRFSPNGAIMTVAGPALTGKGSVLAPEAYSDGEPSIRADALGNVYPAGIRGVPAGVDVWRFGPDAYCPASQVYRTSEFTSGDPADGYVWLGQPDGIFPVEGEGSPDAGGGDIEITVSSPTETAGTATPRLSMVSLTLANITTAASEDRGNTWSPAVPVSAVAPPADRQWIDAYGDKTVYLYYRTLATLTGLVLQKSVDGGLTYSADAVLANPIGYTPGWIAVDRSANRDGSVDIYLSAQQSSEAVVIHCVDANPALPGNVTCGTPVVVDKTTAHGHLFDVLGVDRSGNVYVAWSDNRDVYYAYSTDKGETWSDLVRVTTAAADGMPNHNIFPWITAGEDGRLGIVWYGSYSPGLEDADGQWKAYYAHVENARAAQSAVRWLPASDHVNHVGNISQSGFGSGEANNRNLIDFFQVAFDPRDGAAVIAFAGDNNDHDGHTYYTRQIAGPGLRSKAKVTQPAGGCPVPPPLRDPEVRDFRGDATAVSTTELPTPDTDLLNIDFSWEEEGGRLFLTGDMAVDALLVPPAGKSYRMYFSLNARNGAPDLGNEYFLEVGTASDNVTPVVNLGVLDRQADGVFQERVVADIAADQPADGPFGLGAPGHLRARVDVSRLTYAFQAGGTPTAGAVAPPSRGALVLGLRGRSRQKVCVDGVCATPTVDEARGGSFIILGAEDDGGDGSGKGGKGDRPPRGKEDFDGDGIPDPKDKDDDNDGVPDKEDDDDDNDGIVDDEDDDDDNDGYSDFVELGVFGIPVPELGISASMAVGPTRASRDAAGPRSFRLTQAPPEASVRPGLSAISASVVPALEDGGAPAMATPEVREAVRRQGITALAFAVPDGREARVRIRVFDPAGRLVRTLADQAFEGGAYRLQWDLNDERGARVAPGIYIAVMEAPGYRGTTKLVVMP